MKTSLRTLSEPRRSTARVAATPAETSPPRLSQSISRLDGVSLAELDRAQLHDRMETKVVMRTELVPTALRQLRGDYLVMDHEGRRTQRYSNTYFDTSDLRNYRQHHNQKRQRAKIRYRSYVDSGLTFFEVKRNVDGRTVKERKSSAPVDGSVRAEDRAFLTERLEVDPCELKVSIVVDYDRILLVRRDFEERVTVDMNLRFRTCQGEAAMPGLAIVEFKQPRLDRNSPAIRTIQRPTQMFSKYCMGLASCEPGLKRNRFKKVFLGLERLGIAPARLEATVA